MVEAEPRMASVVCRSLAKVGTAADVVAGGEDTISMATVVNYDAIVLDLILPGISGGRSPASCPGPMVAGRDPS